MSGSTEPQRRNLPVAEARAALKEHFTKYTGDAYAQGWDDLWNKGDFLPWDRMAPSPALADTLAHHSDVVGNALVEEDGQPRRKRALVPGCGRGVDALLLASFGYDTVGLEYSQKAYEACEAYAKENGDKYPVRDEKVGKGSITFVQGDFYANEWVEKLGLGRDLKFDLIYDYTVSGSPTGLLGKTRPRLTFSGPSSSAPCSPPCDPRGRNAPANSFAHRPRRI